MEFRSKSQKQSWNDGTQVQQLECEWELSRNLPNQVHNLIWNCFDIWNSGRKAKKRVKMTEPKSSNLSVKEKLSKNLPNQFQQLDLKLFWYMEFRWPKKSKFLDKTLKLLVELRNFNCNLIWNCFDTWNSGGKAESRVDVTELKSSNLSVNEKLSRNLPNQFQQLDLKLLW